MSYGSRRELGIWDVFLVPSVDDAGFSGGSFEIVR